MGTKTATVDVNGTTLYYERRGSGPTVLLISGMTGDAGHFAEVAEALSDEFDVITYDRRNNSRSRPVDGPRPTSMDEQADDAAALLEALGATPAAVFGTSGGGIILSNVVLRHPHLLRGVIIHEPPFLSVLPDPAAAMEPMQAMLEDTVAQGGPRLAMERFIRWAAGDAVFEGLDPDLRERMLSNAEVGLGLELEAFMAFDPTSLTPATVKVPVIVSAGEENRDPAAENHMDYVTSEWLARRLEADLIDVPGGHAGYLSHPAAFAESLRPLLRKLG